jgi:glycerate kinase
VRAIHAPARLKGVEFLIACDVTTRFVDAASVFAPQKGATSSQIRLLTGRLERLVQMYKENLGVDVSDIEGAGAAGGLAGGLVALGGKLIPGFELVADEVNLESRMKAADIVITGEGCLDHTSYDGKVIGGVMEAATRLNKRVGAIVGRVELDDELDRELMLPSPIADIGALNGVERAMNEPLWCIEHAALDVLRAMTS